MTYIITIINNILKRSCRSSVWSIVHIRYICDPFIAGMYKIAVKFKKFHKIAFGDVSCVPIKVKKNKHVPQMIKSAHNLYSSNLVGLWTERPYRVLYSAGCCRTGWVGGASGVEASPSLTVRNGDLWGGSAVCCVLRSPEFAWAGAWGAWRGWLCRRSRSAWFDLCIGSGSDWFDLDGRSNSSSPMDWSAWRWWGVWLCRWPGKFDRGVWSNSPSRRLDWSGTWGTIGWFGQGLFDLDIWSNSPCPDEGWFVQTQWID